MFFSAYVTTLFSFTEYRTSPVSALYICGLACTSSFVSRKRRFFEGILCGLQRKQTLYVYPPDSYPFVPFQASHSNLENPSAPHKSSSPKNSKKGVKNLKNEKSIALDKHLTELFFVFYFHKNKSLFVTLKNQ